MYRVGNVIDQETIGNRRVVSMVSDDPFFGALKFFERSAADDLEFAFEIAPSDHNRSALGNTSAGSGNDVRARLLGYKRAVGIDACAIAADRPARGEIIRGRSF